MAPFKSTLAKSVGKLLGVYREPDLSLRGATQNSRRIIPITTYDTLVIMVAGGGAGGGGANGADGGGGGGGEVKFGPLTLQSAASYVFRAGDGGPAPGNNTPTGENGNGTPSFISSPLFTTVTAQGGGGGGTGGSNAAPGFGAPGGSGGGGGGDGGSPGDHDQDGGAKTAADATSPYYSFQGYGGEGGKGGEDGGGGGGANPSTGSNGSDGVARDGASGKSIDDFAYPLIQPAVPSPIQPTFGPQVGPGGYFGGGGCQGGEGQEPANRHPNGGGGGGPGNSNNPGTELTGGGGAGYESSNPGGNGGAGVIIMRIPASNAPQVTVPGGVTSVAPGNGYKYFLFSGVATTSYPVSVAPGA